MWVGGSNKKALIPNSTKGTRMKAFICSLVLLASASSYAGEIIKILDGSSASCKTLVDYLDLQTSGAYRPLSYERVDGKSILTLEFLRCEKTDTGFAFKRTNNRNGTYTVSYQPRTGTEVKELLIEKSAPTVIAYNGRGRVLARSASLRSQGGVYVADLSFDDNELDATFLGLRFDFSLESKIVIKDKETGKVIDSGKKFSGAYALIVR